MGSNLLHESVAEEIWEPIQSRKNSEFESILFPLGQGRTIFIYNSFSSRTWLSKDLSFEMNNYEIYIKSIEFLGAISDNEGLGEFIKNQKAITITESWRALRCSQPSLTSKSSQPSWTTSRCKLPRWFLRCASA